MASTPGNPGGLGPGGWRPPDRLYFITMDEAPVGHLQQVEEACEAGIRLIQLRMKDASDAVFRETAGKAKAICEVRGCVLLINDRVEAAAAIEAHGVHLGKEDMTVSEARRILGEDKIIGGTANTFEDIRKHYEDGADYIGLGPFQYTATKKKLSPILGLEGYRRVMNKLAEEGMTIPVFAIGGIGAGDVRSLVDAGLYGVAFSGLLVQEKGDKAELVKHLKQSILC